MTPFEKKMLEIYRMEKLVYDALALSYQFVELDIDYEIYHATCDALEAVYYSNFDEKFWHLEGWDVPKYREWMNRRGQMRENYFEKLCDIMREKRIDDEPR